MKEAEDHNDIIVEDFHDTYLNLTIKTTYLLKWLGGASNCSRAKFVLKVENVAFHLNTIHLCPCVTIDCNPMFAG